eukprot:CAMPEP_0171262660 /NCGR_PEP_ID=MMETSP0790-20130122/56682_1 /TAXON_ID=2925 /ORGANISM="Alexandrium catenella, Strain OF101" /LENGTH=124 /DNA_ID=CAMNT_0011731221 /DNA_START=145 /DNA_END=514 /DNA_ORIENTATION=-
MTGVPEPLAAPAPVSEWWAKDGPWLPPCCHACAPPELWQAAAVASAPRSLSVDGSGGLEAWGRSHTSSSSSSSRSPAGRSGGGGSSELKPPPRTRSPGLVGMVTCLANTAGCATCAAAEAPGAT